MYQLTLTPNRDPGPAPVIRLVTYEQEPDGSVWAIRRTWHLWPGQWAMVSWERLTPDQLYREHVGPTIRTTTRMQLIADGLLKPTDVKRWRKSAKSVKARTEPTAQAA